jgi:transposase
MSRALWYHGLGIRDRGWRHVGTEFSEKTITVRIAIDLSYLACPSCGSRDVIRQGQVERRLLAGQMNFKRVIASFGLHRVKCRACGAVRQIKIGFAEENRRYTRQFERYVLELSREMTIQGVARHLGVSWDVVKDIQKRYLGRKFGKPKLKDLRVIAIDEIYMGKRHRFRTLVMDLETGAVVFVGEGKGAAALDPFWKRLGRTKAKIRAVAADMSAAYMQAVSENLPGAVMVLDHFHVIKLFNEKLTQLRRDIYRETTDLLHREVLKGTRWLLVKNWGNLNDKRNEKQRLLEALHINQPLATAYYLKEELGLLWKQQDKASADSFLKDWIARAQVSGVRILQKFSQTLAAHRPALLAYYDHPISTGPLEATNNKIKTMQRKAYGYRDLQFFTLKIYASHNMKYALVG